MEYDHTYLESSKTQNLQIQMTTSFPLTELYYINSWKLKKAQ